MSGARQGRRRRILQDEVLSASRELAAYAPESDNLSGEPSRAEGRRYAMPSGSLAYALAKYHFPGNILVSVGVLVASLLVVGALAALDVYQQSIYQSLGFSLESLVDAAQPTSLANWITVSTMMVTALLATMILIVRRHRVDDYRGRHRLWRGAIGLAVFLSMDAATNLHATLATAMGQVTGLQLLAGNQGWWIAIGTLIVGWVAFRVFSDIKESRLATVVFAVAMIAGLVSVVLPLTGVEGAQVTLIATLSGTLSYLLTTTVAVIYMRYLSHDVVAGVVTKPHLAKVSDDKAQDEPASVAKTAKPKAKTVAATAKKTETAETQASTTKASSRNKTKQRKPEPVASEETNSQWTDGSDGYSESYDDHHSGRKLSKSERKRLRKQKASRRAA